LGNLIEVDATINGKQCGTLVDTGSQVTLVSRAYYNENLKDVLFTPLDELLNIASVSDEITSYDGVIELNVSFPIGIFGDTTEKQILALVSKDTECSDRIPITAGTNWLDQYDCKVYGRRDKKKNSVRYSDTRRAVRFMNRGGGTCRKWLPRRRKSSTE
jgi:hypothetical protein